MVEVKSTEAVEPADLPGGPIALAGMIRPGVTEKTGTFLLGAGQTW